MNESLCLTIHILGASSTPFEISDFESWSIIGFARLWANLARQLLVSYS